MVVRQVKEVMWRLVWVNNEADVRRYVLALDAAAKDGKLDPEGSLVPYLKFAVSLALRTRVPIVASLKCSRPSRHLLYIVATFVFRR